MTFVSFGFFGRIIAKSDPVCWSNGLKVISLLNKFRVWTKGWNMKKNIILLLTALLLLPTVMQARDTIGDYSIKETLNLGKVKSKLGSGVKFYFGDQGHPKVLKDFGEFRTSKKTSSFMKSDAEACQWVFASALIALRDRAIKRFSHTSPITP